jgi:exodeoxyribonuclease VII small subunit
VPKPAESPGTPSFDQRLARLEAIVSELESGGLALEEAIGRYQEGVGLLRDCRGVLEGLRARVAELSADGTLAAAPDPDLEGG